MTSKGKRVRVGGPAHRSSVTLRLFGDDLDPDEITQTLGRLPTSARRKGDKIPDSDKPRVAQTGGWLLSSASLSGGNLEQEINALLGELTSSIDVWAALTKQFKVDLYCGVYFAEQNLNGGFGLSSTTLAALSERNIGVEFDIYWE